MRDLSPSHAGTPGKLTILVVDDEPSLRMSFRLALSTEGYDVRVAASGEEALRMLERDRFDLMLLDLRMPGIDGIGVLRQLAASGQTVPTIIASAHMDESVVLEALQLGAVDFLSKPVQLRDLRSNASGILDEELSVKGQTPPKPVARARCLLRRRRAGDALAELQAHPRDHAAWRLWSRVARGLASSTSKTELCASLRELVEWNPSHPP